MKGFLQYLNEIQKTNKPLFLVICAVLAVFLYPIVSILGGVFGPRVFAWVVLGVIFSTFFIATFSDDKDISANLEETNTIERVVLMIIFGGTIYMAVVP